MRGPIAAAVVTAVLVGGAAGQDAVTFKNYAYKVGDRTRTVTSEDTTSATTFVAGGKEQTKNEKKKKSYTYATEVIEVGPDAEKPTKRRRTYEKAVEEVDGVETKQSLHGRTVTIERSGDKYAFSADGAPLDAAALKVLDAEFAKKGKSDDNFFPKGGVKVGQSWDLTEQFLKEMEKPESAFALVPKRSVVTGKLLAVTKKGAATFGEIQVTGELPLAEIRGKLPLKLNPGSAMKMSMKGSGALDGTSPEGNMTMTMTMTMDGGAMGVTVKANIEIKTTSRTERLGGKK